MKEQENLNTKVPKKAKDPRGKLFTPEKNFVLTTSPHDYMQASVPVIMWSVMAALVPTTAMAIYYFGLRALVLIVVCTVTCLLTEVLINRLRGLKITIKDGSAAITGLLLALTLPPSLSVVYAVLGSIFAIAIGKQIFGGLGFNIFNPALIGRAFIQTSFPVAITTWSFPITEKFAKFDAVTAATPLGKFKFEKIDSDYTELITGNIAGSLGETSVIAILIGGLFLLVKQYADWRIPVSLLGTVAIFGGIFWLVDPTQYPDPIFQLCSGGLMLGAFFMATDMVTSPITNKGAWLFGIGTGIIVVIIRIFGGIPEGVMYAILLMNALVPLINRYTRPKFFGEVR